MRLSALSLQALHFAARLPGADEYRIARWLYRYGTLPRTPDIERDFGTNDEPMAVLGLTANGLARRRLAEVYNGATYPGWHSFSHQAASAVGHTRFKLYVSPRPEALASAFPIIVDRFSHLDVCAFKVGRGLDGLLRPDKIVAYFESRAHLNQVAAELAVALSGCPAQGVPFTAPFLGTETAASGLLSQGIDPPPGTEAASWRAWITRRLAKLLVEARPATGPVAAEAALFAAKVAGIDTRNWSADEALFTPDCT